MSRELDIAWAAGLFEGEGCASLGRRRDQNQTVRYQVVIVSLEMTDEDVVRRFHSIVGVGNVIRAHRATRRNKATYRWSTGKAEDVLAVLGMLWPFLGERRKQRVTEMIECAARAMSSRRLVGYCHNGHDLTDPQHVGHAWKGRYCLTCKLERARRKRALAALQRPAEPA